VQASLGKDEVIKYSATLSLARYWFRFFIGGVLLITALPGLIASFTVKSDSGAGSALGVTAGVMLFGAALLIIWPFVVRKSTELVVTDKRVLAKFGVLSTHSIEIRFDKIETVRVNQGLLGKLFKYGDIMVTGTGSTFDPIANISHPLLFRTALNQAMELRAAPAH
jgi:uncharacterized membrane protein YdbT with pleckstrin-like domain